MSFYRTQAADGTPKLLPYPRELWAILNERDVEEQKIALAMREQCLHEFKWFIGQQRNLPRDQVKTFMEYNVPMFVLGKRTDYNVQNVKKKLVQLLLDMNYLAMDIYDHPCKIIIGLKAQRSSGRVTFAEQT